MQTLYNILGWLFGGVEITGIIWPRWEDWLVCIPIAAVMVYVNQRWVSKLFRMGFAYKRLERIKKLKTGA
jgi:hypothetical protein